MGEIEWAGKVLVELERRLGVPRAKAEQEAGRAGREEGGDCPSGDEAAQGERGPEGERESQREGTLSKGRGPY